MASKRSSPIKKKRFKSLMHAGNTGITARIHALRLSLQQEALKTKRDPASIHLLAVSKNRTVDVIQEAFDAGLHSFGESYWQEAETKINTLKHLPITWHFIGPIQSNKAQHIAEHVSWVQSVSREKIANKLNLHRPEHLPPLNICLQVNLDNEPSKSGVMLDELESLAHAVLTMPKLKLRGLMAIPQKNVDAETSYQTFLRLKHALETLNRNQSLSLDTLSMGMSDDFIPAIRAGSTCLRIGRSIFNEPDLY
jgi:PLP dependent protein